MDRSRKGSSSPTLLCLLTRDGQESRMWLSLRGHCYVATYFLLNLTDGNKSCSVFYCSHSHRLPVHAQPRSRYDQRMRASVAPFQLSRTALLPLFSYRDSTSHSPSLCVHTARSYCQTVDTVRSSFKDSVRTNVGKTVSKILDLFVEN